MVSSTPALGAFPSPFSIDHPPGCEGWEEMYPYYAMFDERRRETEEHRFWFWNSMHFPVPMPAFDVFCIHSPYQAVGSWQKRVLRCRRRWGSTTGSSTATCISRATR